MKNLTKLDGDLSGALENATRAGALIVQNDAKVRIVNWPLYKTGNLMRSIHMETAERTEERCVVEVGTDVVYAPPHEFGTDTIPARPYLRPAANENKDKVQKEIRDALADIVRKAI